MIRKTSAILPPIIVTLLIALVGNSFAWDNKVTHKALSKIAAEKSLMGNSNDLKALGFSKGLEEQINGKEVFLWIQDGGYREDEPLTRSFNHFHNSLKPWTQAGLDDWIVFHLTGKSSLLWAQDGSYQQSSVNEDWSFEKTREYYYLALISANNSLRQENFAKTFRGLGHQMHLIQDMSVPDHVRNDAHPEDAIFGRVNSNVFFESWTKENNLFVKCLLENHSSLPPDILLTCQQYGINENVNIDNYFPTLSFDPSSYQSLDASYYDKNLAPSAFFFDTDQYNKTNPSASLTQGLAEYTNANFFSGDTIFAAERYSVDHRHYFPYPKSTSTDLPAYLSGNKPRQTVTARDGKVDAGIWISKTGDGEEIQYLVRTSKLTKPLYYVTGQSELFYKSFYRDERCHQDYASKLIPRAVGYSAGLLNYFFRGVLEISAPDQYVYAITDGSRVYPYAYTDDQGNTYQTQQQLFSHIKAKVLNITPREKDPEGNVLSYEDIVSGSLIAVARYKVIPNYSPDLANYPPDGTVMMNEIEYRYSISQPLTMTPEQIISLNAEPMEFTFDFTGNEIPAGITDLTLQVVFKGTLGNETDVAVAVGMKNLMEPAHQVFWNLTDMFSLSDGEAYHLYTSEQIKNDSSLRTIVDLDHDGEVNEAGEPYIDPHPVTYEVGYMGEPEPTDPPFTVATAMNLPAGSHVRLIVLVDDELSPNFLRLVWSDPIDSDTNTHDFEFFGVINEELNGVWQTPTQTEDFRHGLSEGIQIPIRQHFHTGILSCYPLLTDPVTGYKHCPYPEEEALPADLIPYPAVF